MTDKVSVFAPASISNLACGFDVFGFAIENVGDIVTAEKNDSGTVVIVKISGDDGRLPLAAEKNTAGIAVQHVLQKIKSKQGISLSIEKRMPFASGMGSSAASAAAAAKATNVLLNEPLNDLELLDCVVQAEKFIGNTAHADNAAPALWGGFILARCTDPLDVQQLPIPENLSYAIVHPQIEINTGESRQSLPQKIDLKIAVKHWANTAAFVHALHIGDLDLLGRAMEDLVAEPVRSGKIDYYAAVKKIALEKGAIACNISGSGPAIFSLCHNLESAKTISAAMQNIYQENNISHSTYHGKIRKKGAEILT